MMAVKANRASGAENSARNRLVAARIALSAGWVALVVSLPMIMNYAPGGSAWNPGPLRPEYTWAVVHWYVGPADMLRKLLLAPFFVGLAAGTLATILPSRFDPRGLVWACRLGAVGVCEVVLLSLLWMIVNHFDPNVRGGFGIGFLFFAVGSLLIGLSAWIRPVRAKIDGENGKQSASSDANPNSGTGET